MISDSHHPLSHNVIRRMEEFAKIWQDCAARPNVACETAKLWDDLLDTWLDSDLPIFVNQPGHNRGSLFQHRSGRLLIPTDESPAVWAFGLALAFRCPSLAEVRQLQREDRIPIASDLTGTERLRSLYRCKGDIAVKELGWRLCHQKQIGIDDRIYPRHGV